MATDSDQELAFASLPALARRLRARELSAVDLAEASLSRIEAIAPRLGCFARVTPERARNEARAAASELAAGRWRGPLHGIPYALADVIDTRGIPTALGLAALAGRTPERDAEIVARLAGHGAVLLGKLQVFPPAMGERSSAPAAATRSPWDARLTVGGPSPGAAVAVAAGLVPLAIAAHGTGADAASAECGITALRPTYGVLPRRGATTGSFTLGALGAVARSADECALALDALAGPDPRDPSSVGVPPGITRLAPALPKGLRIGVVELPAPGAEVPDAWSGVQDALRAAGAILAPASLPNLPWEPLALLLAEAEGTVLREDVLEPRAAGGAVADEARSATATAADYVRAARVRGEGQRRFATLFERYDLLLAPGPAAPAGADGTGPNVDRLAAAVALCGLPALTLPIGLTGGGPIAARLVAPPLEEARLLTAAASFQARSSHHLNRPPLGPGRVVNPGTGGTRGPTAALRASGRAS